MPAETLNCIGSKLNAIKETNEIATRRRLDIIVFFSSPIRFKNYTSNSKDVLLEFVFSPLVNNISPIPGCARNTKVI